MHCPNCHRAVAEGRRSCLYCGSPLPPDPLETSETPSGKTGREEPPSGTRRNPSREDLEELQVVEGISLQKTPARKPPGKFLLALIFLLSFAMAGFIVILMM